ncbi:Tetrachloroethene reductive dehalogenase TceA membrane-bound subunit [Dehalococcoides mccartyi]|uniref:Tetrachloroethene reductive dehalogenase TceA membrane-bound subunit n=1 Tax=Dehalococcoides mccartyi TaxID=61435 RepID=A0A328ENE2_9CHLR|nr:Tetrachloroethene reductive dehalogenase TceA membrane-bound subunit [Dehalococcoides mccartyi]
MANESDWFGICDHGHTALHGSQIEMYMTAGWFGSLALGAPAIILFVIVWRLIAGRQKAS